jgi:pyruvate formate lyase activating enzyme
MQIAQVTDLFLYDLKLADNAAHKKYTGADNNIIKSNAMFLAGTGAEILFRLPLVPGVNDTEANIRDTAAFIKGLGGAYGLQLMPYHRMGQTKYAALGREYACADMQAMTEEEIVNVRGAYEALGVECSISK